MQLEIYSLMALKDQISVSLEAICDSYSSLLWDIEFYQCGCFEVYIAASPQNVSIFQRGRIVARSDDAQHFGIIESLQLETDAEKGDYLTVTGRSPDGFLPVCWNEESSIPLSPQTAAMRTSSARCCPAMPSPPESAICPVFPWE